MKKAYSFIAFVIVMILLLTGCVIEADRPAISPSPSQANTSAAAVISPSAEASVPAMATAIPSPTLEPDSIKPVALTDRESQYVSIFLKGKMLTFDYSTSHAGVVVWLEKYVSGVDKGGEMNTDTDGNNGTIVFAANYGEGLETPEFYLYAGSPDSNSTESSGEVSEWIGMSGVMDGIKEEAPFSGDVFLGYLECNKENNPSGLSPDFLKDYKSHLGELKNIDVAYLLMCKFTDETHDSDGFNVQMAG